MSDLIGRITSHESSGKLEQAVRRAFHETPTEPLLLTGQTDPTEVPQQPEGRPVSLTLLQEAGRIAIHANGHLMQVSAMGEALLGDDNEATPQTGVIHLLINREQPDDAAVFTFSRDPHVESAAESA